MYRFHDGDCSHRSAKEMDSLFSLSLYIFKAVFYFLGFFIANGCIVTFRSTRAHEVDQQYIVMKFDEFICFVQHGRFFTTITVKENDSALCTIGSYHPSFQCNIALDADSLERVCGLVPVDRSRVLNARE